MSKELQQLSKSILAGGVLKKALELAYKAPTEVLPEKKDTSGYIQTAELLLGRPLTEEEKTKLLE